MATEHPQEDPSFEEEFSNWAKTVLSLQNARDGSISYIKSKMEAFVEEQLRMHGSDEEEHFKELLTKVAVKGQVNESKKQLLPKDRFVLANNSCTTCNKVFEKQLNEFKESRWHSKTWLHNSTENQVDPSSYWWVLAKMYIAKSDIVHAKGPEEVEPSAIFKLLSNCKLFDDGDISGYGEKLVKVRNKLVHSPTNRLKSEKMKKRFAFIKEFLKLVAGTEIINEVEKLEKSTVELFEENGEFSKRAKEALHLQDKSVNADIEKPEGIKVLGIKALGALNLTIKQQERKAEESERKLKIKCEELRKEKEQQEMESKKRDLKLKEDYEENLRKEKEQQEIESKARELKLKEENEENLRKEKELHEVELKERELKLKEVYEENLRKEKELQQMKAEEHVKKYDALLREKERSEREHRILYEDLEREKRAAELRFFTLQDMIDEYRRRHCTIS